MHPTTSPSDRSRRQVRLGAAGFLALGLASLVFDLLSRDPGQMRYLLGAIFLTGLSALTFHQAR
jgi:hypothetical protein